MGKSIKLVTLVGDEEVVVGRCHPGQARILRKNGLAEWKKDRLVLLTPTRGQVVATVQSSDGTRFTPEALEELAKQWNEAERDSAWEGYTLQKILQFADTAWEDEVEAIDPEGHLVANAWVHDKSKGYNRDRRLNPEEVQSQTLRDWVEEAVKRREAGHLLLEADDPKRLMLGFVDDDTNEVFYLGLRKMKMAADEDLEDLDVTVKELSTNEGRRKLLGLDPEDERPHHGMAEPDPELESLWVQEVEDTLGKEVREAQGVKLADEWAKLLSLNRKLE